MNKEEQKCVGKIIGISDLNVKVLINKDSDVKIRDILYFEDEKSVNRFEVVEINANIAMAVPFDTVHGIKKGIDLFAQKDGLQIEYSDKILGKMFNSYGDLIDGNKITKPVKRNIYDKKLICMGKTLSVLNEEKLLKRLGLGMPFIVELNKYLMDYGMIDKYSLTNEKLVNAIWK